MTILGLAESFKTILPGPAVTLLVCLFLVK